jgi:hypothetical protein
VRCSGFLGDLMRFIIVAVALLFSSLSFSADYYFARSSTNEHLPSAKASCDAFFVAAGGGYYYYALIGGPSIYQCQYKDAYGNL